MIRHSFCQTNVKKRQNHARRKKTKAEMIHLTSAIAQTVSIKLFGRRESDELTLSTLELIEN
jgi:hypothetical protein